MKTKLRRMVKSVLPAFIGIVILSSLAYSFYLLSQSASYFDNESAIIALRYSMQATESVRNEIETSLSEVERIASQAGAVSDFEKMDEFGNEKVEQYGFICLQFLQDGVPEYRYGESVGSASEPQVQQIIASGRLSCSKIYIDPSLGIPCVAVYSPVQGSALTDGVLAYFAVSKLFNGTDNLHQYTRYYFFCSQDGGIVETQVSDGMKTDVSHNAFDYLYNISQSKAAVDTVRQNAVQANGGVSSIIIDGDKYVAVCTNVDGMRDECFILQLFSADEILRSEYLLYDRVLGVSVFLAIFAVAALVISSIQIHSDKKKLLRVIDRDPKLGCNTYQKFMLEAKTILEENRFARYAVVYFDIYKFHYIKEHLGDQEAGAILEFVSNICRQMTDDNESFGHAVDDSFVMILHYTDLTELGERIKLMGTIVSNYTASGNTGVDIKISVGIFPVRDNSRRDIDNMLDCAKIAMRANRSHPNSPYTVYDSAIASAYLMEAEYESKMKAALRNREFKLFFQPKYSIRNDRMDSAEVLVRWYDLQRQSYVAPDSFIRLFEANGFIAELDHYVFEETCSFMNNSIAEGDRMVPLSVNVSRATAIRPDFLKFYIEKKKEYGVADGFITLEFTESFAADCYELFETLITTLRSNGFRCSIDDFGMGSSSLIAVKELSVDELKLDRALIKHGKDPAKDDALLKMLISVSKDLGMTVTQEGVETVEDLNRMKALGCDIIQGYYYAKPMHVIDFVDFLKEDTSLNNIKRLRPSGQNRN